MVYVGVVIPEMHGGGDDTKLCIGKCFSEVTDGTGHYENVTDGLTVLKYYLVRYVGLCGNFWETHPGVGINSLREFFYDFRFVERAVDVDVVD